MNTQPPWTNEGVVPQKTTKESTAKKGKGAKEKGAKEKAAKEKAAKEKAAKEKAAKGKATKGKAAKGKAVKGKAVKEKGAKGKGAKGKSATKVTTKAGVKAKTAEKKQKTTTPALAPAETGAPAIPPVAAAPPVTSYPMLFKTLPELNYPDPHGLQGPDIKWEDITMADCDVLVQSVERFYNTLRD